MLTCKDVCDNATNYLEGPATFADRMALRVHLLMCKQCRRFIRNFSLTIGVAGKMEQEAPSDDEIDALMEKLAKAQASD